MQSALNINKHDFLKLAVVLLLLKRVEVSMPGKKLEV